MDGGGQRTVGIVVLHHFRSAFTDHDPERKGDVGELTHGVEFELAAINIECAGHAMHCGRADLVADDLAALHIKGDRA